MKVATLFHAGFPWADRDLHGLVSPERGLEAIRVAKVGVHARLPIICIIAPTRCQLEHPLGRTAARQGATCTMGCVDELSRGHLDLRRIPRDAGCISGFTFSEASYAANNSFVADYRRGRPAHRPFGKESGGTKPRPLQQTNQLAEWSRCAGSLEA